MLQLKGQGKAQQKTTNQSQIQDNLWGSRDATNKPQSTEKNRVRNTQRDMKGSCWVYNSLFPIFQVYFILHYSIVFYSSNVFEMASFIAPAPRLPSVCPPSDSSASAISNGQPLKAACHAELFTCLSWET